MESGILGDRLLPGTGSCALTGAVDLSRATLETEEIEALPMIPALKSLTRRLTREDYWRYLRPPLHGLSEDKTRELSTNQIASQPL